MGQHWLKRMNSPSSSTSNPSATSKPSTTLNTEKGALGRKLHMIVALSALCFLLLVTCIALGILYKRESGNDPEWRSLLFDYQNISDHYLTAAAANHELNRDNQNLRRHGSRLHEQTRVLNQTVAKLSTANRDLALVNTRQQEQIANLTSKNSRLIQDHGLLVQHSIKTEEEKLNMSRSIAHLTDSNAKTEEEKQNLLATNSILRDKLVRAEEGNEELLKLNVRFQQEIQNLKDGGWPADSLKDQCEETKRNNTHLQDMIVALEEQNKDLSAELEQERQIATERENSTREEIDLMLVDIYLMNEAYLSLDQYCPVINQTTQERICRKCEARWTLFQSKCYHFSYDTLPWRDSRAWCQTQGGDLVIVNSKEEQAFIMASSQAVDQATTRLWIGLTDAEEEGDWRWVGGGPISTDVQYWLSRPGGRTEPDDWRLVNPLGEDCGHIDTSEKDLHTWMDASCDSPYRWICEKSL